jgi:hypothetical protein
MREGDPVPSDRGKRRWHSADQDDIQDDVQDDISSYVI